MTDKPVVLHEYDKDEWWDVYRTIHPDATREQYEAAWADFQRAKARHQQQQQVN